MKPQRLLFRGPRAGRPLSVRRDLQPDPLRMSRDLVLFGGTANPALAEAVSAHLGLPLGACATTRFPDGEISVRLLRSVRGREVFILQPTSPPVNDNLMELLAFADACRRAAAARIVAVVPYFGYARADRRGGSREPITASVVAGLLESVGIDGIITLDLHTPQMEGFFRIPVDVLTAVPTLAADLEAVLPPDTVIVSPDAGRVTLATEYAQQLGRSLAVLHKHRESGSHTRVTHLVGDVSGRPCLLVDDMISTGGTLVQSVRALRDAGARSVYAAATHGLLIGDALDRLRGAGVERILVTDSVPVREDVPELHTASVAPLLAGAIRSNDRSK